MKKLAIFLITLFTFFLITSTAFADCRGCCSRHGGVVCIDGITKCRDGTPLSLKCQSKGCNKCGSTTEPIKKTQDTAPTSAINSQNPIPFPDNIIESSGEFRILLREYLCEFVDKNTNKPGKGDGVEFGRFSFICLW